MGVVHGDLTPNKTLQPPRRAVVTRIARICSRSSGIRLLDGVIDNNGPIVIARQSHVVLKDHDIIVAQAIRAGLECT